MTSITILEEALKLDPIDKAKMVKEILNSLDVPDKKIDALWEQEALRRYHAYKEGKIKAVAWNF